MGCKGETVKDLYESAIRLSFAQWGVSDGIDQYLNDESSTQADYVDPNENKGNESAISSITIKWKDNAGEEEKLERLITQNGLQCGLWDKKHGVSIVVLGIRVFPVIEWECNQSSFS